MFLKNYDHCFCSKIYTTVPSFFNELSIFLKSINLSLRRGMGPRVLYFHPYPPSNPLWRAIRSLQTIYPGGKEQAYWKKTKLFFCRFIWLQLASLCQLTQWYSLPSVPSLAPLFVSGRGCACVSYQEGEVLSQFQRQQKTVVFFNLYFFMPEVLHLQLEVKDLTKKSAADESLMDCLHLCNSPLG